MCREYDVDGVKNTVANAMGSVSKGELVDFVDYYMTLNPDLSQVEQTMLLTELWRWRERYVRNA